MEQRESISQLALDFGCYPPLPLKCDGLNYNFKIEKCGWRRWIINQYSVVYKLITETDETKRNLMREQMNNIDPEFISNFDKSIMSFAKTKKNFKKMNLLEKVLNMAVMLLLLPFLVVFMPFKLFPIIRKTYKDINGTLGMIQSLDTLNHVEFLYNKLHQSGAPLRAGEAGEKVKILQNSF